MKLKIRYENEFQMIELDAESMEGLWISLSLGTDEGISQDEKEQRLQEAFEVQFNRPEYNNWHRFDRHRGFSRAVPGRDDSDEEIDRNEPLMDEVADDSAFRADELEHAERESYEAECQWVRKVLVRKPEWADMFISVRLNGESIKEYAARSGESENSITQKLKRAAKKLKESWSSRQI